MDSDQLIDLVQQYTDQIEVLKREVEDAVQTVARVVAANGGRMHLPESYLLKDYELVTYKSPDGMYVLASREVPHGRQPQRQSS